MADDNPPSDDEYDGEEETDQPMHADHPLLERAQQALAKQLTAHKTRIEEQLMERTEDLRVAKNRRESIGVELYGVQQQLARLQMTLEKTHDNYNMINRIREQAQEDLRALRALQEDTSKATIEERRKTEKFQMELDKLNSTLKQIEAYNEQMKNEIAVTRRATYVAEESVSKMEKEKKEQDYLIDTLQEQLKQLHQQHQLYEAQLVAQQRETRAAQETLGEAEQEMEAINFEKKQLVQQWKSSLIGMARRDEALQATEEALRKQREQELAIEGEIEGYKRSIKQEQGTNEMLTGVLKKVEGEAEGMQKNITTLREKREKLQDTYIKLKRSLEQTEESMEGAKDEMRLREQELHRVDNDIVKCNQEIQQLEADMLNNLSDQTTVEKSAQKTAQTVQKTRGMVQEHHIQSVQLQNELSKIRVDILNTQAHNNKLKETLGTLDEELKEKGKTIEKYEIEIRRRNDEIEKKTKDVDRLNRQYDKLTANMEDENTGPLEATISNLLREINNKAVEGKDLQRRWVGFQTELVSLINDNNGLAETVQRLKSEHTVLLQKRARLDKQYESHQKEIKELDTSVQHMHTDLQRLNTLIAKHSSLQEVLANDNFNLEMTVVNQLKELETQAVKLENKIDQSTDEKRQTLAELVEAERQIMLWERKIALEKEMQEALDPSIGGDIVDAMKKEIHRMTLRHAELLKQQERLIQEMEKAITRRDFITVKGQVTNKKKQPELTEAGLRKACSELKRSIKETDAEAQRSEGRINDLDQQREKLGENLEDLSVRCKDMQRKEEELRTVLSSTLSEKNKAFQTTTKAQRMVKRFEDYEVGRYKISNDGDRTVILNELGKTHQKTATIRDVVDALIAEEPRLEHNLEKVLTLFAV
ncbi:hypothetical protein CYMTET_51272 [Cymbomonas tetramitiformis]|uniref:Coiled-coil domain-containing protein 40 n=1 Tax=Cymbomonas tetramitiformis TaxID=36881 RepID=A0AAE0BN55_9CHLO|nr:hypothetical protein CYMTET_51272 [Cymbomonas tetramitiformis]